MDHEANSRKAAIELGLAHYFTGEPCKRGHFSKRVTLTRNCVACMREVARQRYAANPQKERERCRRRYATNPERRREIGRKHYALHKEAIREKSRQRYWQDVEASRVNMLRHRKNRIARLIGAHGRIESSDVEWLRAAQKGRCFYCCKKLGKKEHIDHFVPLSRGGSNDRANLRLACPTCNLRKQARLPEEFLGVMLI